MPKDTIRERILDCLAILPKGGSLGCSDIAQYIGAGVGSVASTLSVMKAGKRTYGGRRTGRCEDLKVDYSLGRGLPRYYLATDVARMRVKSRSLLAPKNKNKKELKQEPKTIWDRIRDSDD